MAQRDGKLGLGHFKRVRPLGSGDVGLVDLVELQEGRVRYTPVLRKRLRTLVHDEENWK